ncbi:MAG: hypothetical protein IAE77_21470 [Prosthecobacter sp.]|nr:hypothetical protein [Prosthecobacter sp.]
MSATRLTPARILRELAKMSVVEVEGVMGRLQKITAVKRGALKPSEARLLEVINATLPAGERAEYRKLVNRRRNGTLTPADQRRLQHLSDQVETLHARRVQSVVRLAALRKLTVAEVMKQLGLPSLVTVHG